MFNNWEKDIYGNGQQINVWPFTEVISEVKKIFHGSSLRGKKVAEIGCGTGNNLSFFVAEGCEIFGIDFSPTAIEIAKNFLKFEEIYPNLICGDVSEKLPWDDSSIDIFLDRGCLTQISFNDISAILAEVYRVLSPDGLFFSFTLFGDDSSDLSFGKLVGERTYDDFKSGYFSKVGKTSVYSQETLRKLLVKFEILKMKKSVSIDLLEHSELATYSFIAQKKTEV